MSGASRRFQRRQGSGHGSSGPRHDLVLEFRRGLYYCRIWFLHDEAKTMDIFALLRRELPDGAWRLDYRFRYYRDGKTFDSDDRKSFYSGEYSKDAAELEVVEKTTEAIALIAEMQGLLVDETVIESDDPDVIFAKIRENPYFDARVDNSGVKQ